RATRRNGASSSLPEIVSPSYTDGAARRHYTKLHVCVMGVYSLRATFLLKKRRCRHGHLPVVREIFGRGSQRHQRPALRRGESADQETWRRVEGSLRDARRR